MDTRNKAILGMFTLAFCSLAGLQIAGKAISYSQSSVLGEKSTMESTLPGKRNYSACLTNEQCNSGRCDEVKKLCIPKSAPTRVPTQTQLEQTNNDDKYLTIAKATMSPAEYVPCSDLKALQTKYCTLEKPKYGTRVPGQISCATFLQNLLVFCKPPLSPRPTIVPLPF